MIDVGEIETRLRLSLTHRVPGNVLPDFAQGAINLGRELYRAAVAGQPRTVILVIPTRKFFSALLSLGAAEAALNCGTRLTPKPNPGEIVIAHFETGGFHVAIFEGEEEDPHASGRIRTFLRLKGEQRISVFSDSVTLLGHPHGPHVRASLSSLGSMKESPPAVVAAQGIFGVKAVRDLYSAVPASTIVGTKSWVEEDMESIRFDFAETTSHEATLGDLLLVNHPGFLPPLVKVQAYTANDLGEVGSSLTILDGANATLWHGVHLGTGSQAIVFDAATPEATLDLAVNAIANQLAFHQQDPDWSPLHHTGLALTERVAYLRKATP